MKPLSLKNVAILLLAAAAGAGFLLSATWTLAGSPGYLHWTFLSGRLLCAFPGLLVSLALLAAPRSLVRSLRETILARYAARVPDNTVAWLTFRLIGALFGGAFLVGILTILKWLLTGCANPPACR
jgi:hypothetical protein